MFRFGQFIEQHKQALGVGGPVSAGGSLVITGPGTEIRLSTDRGTIVLTCQRNLISIPLGPQSMQGTLTIDPHVTAFYPVGPHWVYIPAGALCAPGTTYGTGEWDKDCVGATQKLSMDVTWGERNGRGVVEFHTDVRFKPTTQPLKAVYLFMQESSLSFSRYGVLWRDASGNWVDEALTDRSLRAFRVNGVWVGRRVKHFSGYNVALGMYEEQADPTLGAQ